MNQRAKVFALLLAGLLLGACTGGVSPIQATAERAEFDAIAPAHRAYLEADPLFNENDPLLDETDPSISEEQKAIRRAEKARRKEQKARRLLTLELWDLRVTALEKAVSQ